MCISNTEEIRVPKSLSTKVPHDIVSQDCASSYHARVRENWYRSDKFGPPEETPTYREGV